MKTSVHIIASTILAIPLYFIFGWKVLFIFIGGVALDIDHYIWYVFKHKDINPLNCYRHFMKGLEKDNYKFNIGILFIFHSIEFLTAAALLSFFSEFVLMFAIGLLPHYMMDLLYLYRGPKRFITNPSIIGWFIKNKFKKFK